MIFGSGASAGVLGLGVVFTLKDQFSRTADNINRKFGQMEANTDRMMAKLNAGIKTMKTGLGVMAVGAGILVALSPAVSKTAELSDKMADVRKTTGMASMEVEDLKKQLYELDTRTSIGELLDIATIGGQMGVAKDQILGFVKAMDLAVVALGDEFGGGADQISTVLGGVRNVLSDIKSQNIGDDLTHIANALNILGASGIATAPVISDFATRMGGMGIQLGMSSGQILGLSAVMQESSITAERGSSAAIQSMMKMTTHISEFAKVAGMSATKFKALVNRDILGAFTAVVRGATQGNVSTTEFAETLDALGLDGVRTSETFALLAKNLDMLDDKVRLATEGLTGMDSIQAEFDVKNQTLAATLDKLSNRWDRLLDIVGGAASTVLAPLVKGLTKIVDLIADLAATTLGQVIIGIVTALGVLLTVVGGAIAVFGLFQVAVWGAQIALTALGVTAAAVFWPITLVVAAIAAIVGAVVLAKKSVEEFNAAMEDNEKITGGWTGVLQKAGGMFEGMAAIWNSATRDGFSLTEKMAGTLEKMGILDEVLALGTWIVRIKEFMRGLSEPFVHLWGIIKDLWNLIKNRFLASLDSVGMHFQKAEGSMSTWHAIGKAIGTMLEWTVIPAIYILAAALDIVMQVIAAVINIFKVLWNVGVNITMAIVNAFMWLVETITSAFDTIASIGEHFGSFFSFLDAGNLGTWWDMVTADDAASNVELNTPGQPKTEQLNNQVSQNKAMAATAGSRTVEKTVVQEKTVQPVFVMDGREFAGHIRQIDAEDESRR